MFDLLGSSGLRRNDYGPGQLRSGCGYAARFRSTKVAESCVILSVAPRPLVQKWMGWSVLDLPTGLGRECRSSASKDLSREISSYPGQQARTHTLALRGLGASGHLRARLGRPLDARSEGFPSDLSFQPCPRQSLDLRARLHCWDCYRVILHLHRWPDWRQAAEAKAIQARDEPCQAVAGEERFPYGPGCIAAASSPAF